MKLSEQAKVSLVIIYQRSLLEGKNLNEQLENLQFTKLEGQLWIDNPPTTVKMDVEQEEE